MKTLSATNSNKKGNYHKNLDIYDIDEEHFQLKEKDDYNHTTPVKDYFFIAGNELLQYSITDKKLVKNYGGIDPEKPIKSIIATDVYYFTADSEGN